MRLINKTRYNTEVMRQLFSDCMAQVKPEYLLDWPTLKGLIVKVTYARRRDFISGHAFYTRAFMRLSIPSEWIPKQTDDRCGYEHGDIAQALAATFIHELGHNLGVKNHVVDSAMHKTWACCTIEQRYRAFINSLHYRDYPVAMPPQEKAKPDVRMIRFERALANMQRAETRFKRAKNLLKKWSEKVRYYERTLPQAAKRRKEG